MAERTTRPWELVYPEYDADEQPLREALCALGNGWIVTRGAFEEEAAGGPHYPGTYLAGGYNRLESEVSGRMLENEDLVNWPNWLPLTFRAEGGDWFSLDTVELLDFEVCLDVRRGVLERRLLFRDRAEREFSLTCRRIVHMAQPHLAAIVWSLTARDWSGEIEIRSGLDGTVHNGNVARYQKLATQHLGSVETGREAEDAIYLTARTSQSRISMTLAARTRVFDGATAVPVRRETDEDGGRITQRLFVRCSAAKTLRIEKVVAIHTSRDRAISEPCLAARKEVSRAGTFAELLETHERKWRQLWRISDIELRGSDVETQLILRMHIFHLLQSTSPNTIDRDVGVPARGWHGEAYRGHVFWDELFIFPFLTLRLPELTRSLLMYRYHRLGEARHAARAAGYDGAMFPWQSGSDGREETQVLHLNPASGRWLPDTTHLQRHVNAAIAYNVWQYHQATNDLQFLHDHGAELIIEIARFWASLVTFNAERGRYEIHGVVGPDEFHTDDPNTAEPGLRNNAYTNVMAAWVLRCATGLLRDMEEEQRRVLVEVLQIREEEPVQWDEISRSLFIPFHGECVISQFEGYEKLQEFDWEGYRKKHGDIHRLDRILEAEGDDVNRYQASKQADVLMLFYLFSAEELEQLFTHMGYSFDAACISRNIDYYMQRASHGSTLSRVVHSWVLARSDREEGWHFFQQALHTDIGDSQGGTTQEGIHLGAMAGTVDLIQRGHTGLAVRDDVLWFNPRLPHELADVKLRLRYRNHWLSVRFENGTLGIACDRSSSPAVRIGYRGEVHELKPGEKREFALHE
jgi:trehalose/maltose hydrolase-like predicted phosphorylase